MRYKKLIYILFAAMVLPFFGCEKEYADNTRITYFAEIVLEGSTVVIPVGGEYVEPGFSGSENGIDKTSEIVVSSNVNTAEPGIYTVSYALSNSDGIKKTESRLVIVAVPDADAPASGIYVSAAVRTEADGSAPRPRTSEIAVLNIGNDVFSVSCLLGNYYAAGYGPAYAMVGTIQLDKATNTFTLIDSHVEGWGDGLEDFNNGSYDPATGTLYWESIYAGSDIFAVTSNMQ